MVEHGEFRFMEAGGRNWEFEAAPSPHNKYTPSPHAPNRICQRRCRIVQESICGERRACSSIYEGDVSYLYTSAADTHRPACNHVCCSRCCSLLQDLFHNR